MSRRHSWFIPPALLSLWLTLPTLLAAPAAPFAETPRREPGDRLRYISTGWDDRFNEQPGSGQVHKLELTRTVHPWEFLGAFGTRASVLGTESGRFELWIYPLKILHDLKLSFHLADRILPAESLARTVTVTPESCSILYAADALTVRETVFVPPHEPGAIISLEIRTAEPLEIEVTFERDFQLLWPAALGGSYMRWDQKLQAFVLGEETKKFFALVGSPSATEHRREYFSNYSSSPESSFKLGPILKARERRQIVVAASIESQKEAEAIYQRLSVDFPALKAQAEKYYEEYLRQTIGLRLPDPEIQQAYDWARVSLLEGMVTNPFLGTGLVAGYRISGKDARPGFAWYFGRDALWSAPALLSIGDFEHTRSAVDFLIQYQRADGKIPHEISHSASFVPWFRDYPYAYASADATPLFLLAMNDYAVSSGDAEFVKQRWSSVWKAYQFLRSTWDPQGFAQNQQAGHGWVEGGPLLPVRTELYQSGLGVAAVGALSNLARLVGEGSTQRELEHEFTRQKKLLNDTFWIPEKGIFAFGLDQDNHKVAEASVLAAVPMWFQLLDAEKAGTMIHQLADADHATDWGMRILSAKSSKFFPAGYHFGSVWPLFTGWAAVGEYRYHNALPAFSNLRANALLALDGALGHVTEVLSGAHYAPLSISSPHQIWSSAMVVNSLLRGLLGFEVDAAENRLVLAPHLPPQWNSIEIHNIRLRAIALTVLYRQNSNSIELEVRRSGSGECVLEFSPALSLRADVIGATVNDRPIRFRTDSNAVDQHVFVRFPLERDRSILHLRLRNHFGLQVPVTLPSPGGTSANLKVISESWNASRDQLELEVSGLEGKQYEILLYGAAQILAVRGAELERRNQSEGRLLVNFPPRDTPAYTHQRITIQFGPRKSSGHPSKEKNRNGSRARKNR